MPSDFPFTLLNACGRLVENVAEHPLEGTVMHHGSGGRKARNLIGGCANCCGATLFQLIF
jgi:hypothetical protein